MTDQEKIAVLQEELKKPDGSGKYSHAQIQEKLNTLQPKPKAAPPPEVAAAKGTPKMTVDLGLGPREYDDTDDVVPRVVRGMSRMGEAIRGPALAYNKYIDTMTGGLYGRGTEALSQITGTQIGPSRADYEQLAQQNPLANATATAAGYMNPEGLPAKGSQLVGKGVDLLSRAVAKRGLSTIPGRLAGSVVSGGLKGAGSAALTSVGEDIIAGRSDEEIGHNAKDKAKMGAAFGAVFGPAIQAGREFAAARRAASPDIALLDRYGLEPGPVPGRPVIRKDQPIMRQVPGASPPPLGASRVTPATRGAAARDAADELVPDIRAREQINNQRFGEVKLQAKIAQGLRPWMADNVLSEIDAQMQDARLPASTLAALGQLRQRIIDNSVQTSAGVRSTAMKLDEIRDLADTLGNAEKAAKMPDVPLRQIASMMRDELRNVAPRMAMVNETQHEMLNGFEQRRALLNMPKGNEVGAAAQERTRVEAARRIRQGGEETAIGGIRTSGGQNTGERLADLGAPPVFPGAQSRLPPEPNYRGLLEVPQLQLAQENLQLTPSKVFSGGGVGSGAAGFVSRLATATPDRALYPLARRLGEKTVGSNVRAPDELIGAVKRRREKQRKDNKDKEDRTSP